MGGFFYNLGKKAGPKIRKAQWVWTAATAPEAEVIETERAAGADMAQAVRRMCPPCRDIDKVETLKTIGTRLTERQKNKSRTFNFECLHSEVPQAFCLPGGFVFLSDSMMNLCNNNRHQVAFICAHEMAHVTEGHALDRMLANAIITTLSKSTVLRHAAGAALQKLGIHFLESAYSQDQELRADELGIRLAAGAGFDPKSAIDLLAKLDTSEQTPLLSKYFSTHPPCRKRVDHIKQLLKST